MTGSPLNRDHRVGVVASIITDYWPHRMSIAAAGTIDDYYTKQKTWVYDEDEWLPNGSAVLDSRGYVWTVTRDGLAVMRPLDTLAPNSPIESAGLSWLSKQVGPLTLLYRAPE